MVFKLEGSPAGFQPDIFRSDGRMKKDHVSAIQLTAARISHQRASRCSRGPMIFVRRGRRRDRPSAGPGETRGLYLRRSTADDAPDSRANTGRGADRAAVHIADDSKDDVLAPNDIAPGTFVRDLLFASDIQGRQGASSVVRPEGPSGRVAESPGQGRETWLLVKGVFGKHVGSRRIL